MNVRVPVAVISSLLALPFGACKRADERRADDAAGGGPQDARREAAAGHVSAEVSALPDRPLVEGPSAKEVFAHLPAAEWSEAASAELDEAFATGAQDLHRRVLALLLVAPEDQRPGLAGHVANLTPDSEYSPVAWLIANGSLSPGVADALLGDLHDRSAEIKLPVFAQILSQPDHPLAGEAQRTLITYLQEDYGTPSARWGAAVERYLRDGRDEL